MQELLGRDEQFLQAAKSGDVSTVTKLLDKGVDIEASVPRNHGTSTALHLASSAGNEKIVRLLLSQEADIHAKYEGGLTALHEAAVRDHKQIVELLLFEQRAGIESEDSGGHTAVLWAATGGLKISYGCC